MENQEFNSNIVHIEGQPDETGKKQDMIILPVEKKEELIVNQEKTEEKNISDKIEAYYKVPVIVFNKLAQKINTSSDGSLSAFFNSIYKKEWLVSNSDLFTAYEAEETIQSIPIESTPIISSELAKYMPKPKEQVEYELRAFCDSLHKDFTHALNFYRDGYVQTSEVDRHLRNCPKEFTYQKIETPAPVKTEIETINYIDLQIKVIDKSGFSALTDKFRTL